MKKITPRAAMKAARTCERILHNYSSLIDEKAFAFFGEEFKTEWSLFAGAYGGYVTSRVNGKKLTRSHALYIRGLSDAFAEVPSP